PDVTISAEDVFYLHRVKDGYDLYFLTNTTQRDLGRVEISFERIGRPELWDANTGETTPIHVFDVKDERLVLSLDFPASESHIIVLRDEPVEPRITETNLDVRRFEEGKIVGYGSGPAEQVVATVRQGGKNRKLKAEARKPRPPITLPVEYDFSIEQDNVLLIGSWRMRIEGNRKEAAHFHRPEYDDSEWLQVTNGAWEMQLPQERDEATYPVTLWYRTAFTIRDVPSNPRLLIDGFRGSEYRLYLNGKEVKEKGRRSWLDAEIEEVDIRRYLQEGENAVAVRIVVNKRTEGMLDLLKIVGDFSVEGSEHEGYAIATRRTRVQAGDWTTQGFPFFSGTGVYRSEIDVPGRYLDGGRLYLEADCGEDVLEVSVNGSEGIIVPWHPYRVDVTDLVRAGANAIELKVTNTLINILEGVQLKSGLFKRPRIVHQHRYELQA
ncbi:MAG TPA: hypothetical protein VFG50_13050, partial [Rhodothermales bacterium]|nr:hypothetical protein [Rhodothermales bacterium]